MTKSKVHEQYYEYPIPFDPTVGMDVFSPVDKAPEIEDIDKEFKAKNCYMGNTKIMRAGVEFQYTEEQFKEFLKCANDVLYFIVNYCKIITLNEGIQLFKLFQYQKNAIKIMHENRFSIYKFPRQMGKCVTYDTEVDIRINDSVMKIKIGELYSLVETENLVESFIPNDEYQILTEDGFKDFDGITIRTASELIELVLADGSTIRATPGHEIKAGHDFIKMKFIVVGSNVGVDKQNLVQEVKHLSGEFRVADLISVKDTASFAVNDLSAILSNCIDGNSMITLLDNHTGEIFDIHISELFDYLIKGSE